MNLIPGTWQHALIFTLLGAVAIGLILSRPRRKELRKWDRSVERAAWAEFQDVRRRDLK